MINALEKVTGPFKMAIVGIYVRFLGRNRHDIKASTLATALTYHPFPPGGRLARRATSA